MPMIEDGTGKGYKVKIDDENMAHVLSTEAHLCHHINLAHGEAYSVVVSKTPTGAADCFLYLKNTDDDDLIISSVLLYAATDESVQIKLGDSGTTSGGTANVPTNRNAGSGNSADCTCEDGVDITGLSGGSVVDEISIDGATGSHKTVWRSDILLPKNGIATFYAVTGAIAIKMTVSIGFHNNQWG